MFWQPNEHFTNWVQIRRLRVWVNKKNMKEIYMRGKTIYRIVDHVHHFNAVVISFWVFYWPNASNKIYLLLLTASQLSNLSIIIAGSTGCNINSIPMTTLLWLLRLYRISLMLLQRHCMPLQCLEYSFHYGSISIARQSLPCHPIMNKNPNNTNATITLTIATM